MTWRENYGFAVFGGAAVIIALVGWAFWQKYLVVDPAASAMVKHAMSTPSEAVRPMGVGKPRPRRQVVPWSVVEASMLAEETSSGRKFSAEEWAYQRKMVEAIPGEIEQERVLNESRMASGAQRAKRLRAELAESRKEAGR